MKRKPAVISEQSAQDAPLLSKQPPLRVLSYNIHKGFSSSKRRFTLAHIKKGIRLLHVDLAFLQEVVGSSTRRGWRIDAWPNEPQFEYLADQVWPHTAYGRNAVYSAGHHGNAILSRYPITGVENIDISAHAVEHRGVLHAVIESPDFSKPIHALCLQFGLLEKWRRSQVDLLCGRIIASVPDDAPLIVAGDFNDWRETTTRVLLKRLDLSESFIDLHGAHARTFPSRLPALKLDRVYTRHLKPVRAERLVGDPWRQLSDHTPLVVDLVAS